MILLFNGLEYIVIYHIFNFKQLWYFPVYSSQNAPVHSH